MSRDPVLYAEEGFELGIGAGQQFMPQASAVIRAATRRTGAAVVQPRGKAIQLPFQTT